MKKSIILFSVITACLLTSCIQKKPVKYSIDYDSARDAYGSSLTIEPMNDSVRVGKDTIVIAPEAEDVTYTLSGYFNGTISCTTKNTVIKLKNAFLENSHGEPALSCDVKCEVSAAKDSTNYIVSWGKGYSRNAALEGKRNLVIGGGGTLYVSGKICHGIEAEETKIKGSGTFYIEGTLKGSALNCTTLTVEEEKTFTCYLLNSKNGIKADDNISIASGNFYFYDNGTALKTDDSEDSPHQVHYINLSGGLFHTFNNTSLYSTEDDSWVVSGAKIIEEK
ncbi:carbohydrate-binding domain-containing protein [Treponema sp.]|uniref:carbohydrate-binding domain-containing protein n=1 Tax=Treponema sp. TaxID=166 RepID=UPI0025DD32C5|nr:carbohydrate-binding domain-containing protein [Treponema sp.]MCR5218412.1 carbohydrate-binding domain-containing protein [Treponema sp.]